VNFVPLPSDFQETSPGIALLDCPCDQGRNPPCICAETLAERQSLFGVIWRRVCRFFVTPEFNAQMEAHDAEADRLRG
jgi:hypothetical protein